MRRLVLMLMTVALFGCGAKAPPNLSPEGRAAFYGEKFMAGVEAAQAQTIALVGQFNITKADVTPAVEAFVAIGKGGQELAAALKVIDESDVTTAKQSAAVRARVAVEAFQDILTGVAARVPSESARTRITQIVQTLKLGAALFDVMTRLAPFLPSKPSASLRLEVCHG